jgi:hypothetical protein
MSVNLRHCFRETKMLGHLPDGCFLNPKLSLAVSRRLLRLKLTERSLSLVIKADFLLRLINFPMESFCNMRCSLWRAVIAALRAVGHIYWVQT